MKIPNKLLLLSLLAAVGGLQITAPAQTAWTGATDNNWNNAGNWTNGVPGVGVAAFLTNNSTVTYPAPMAAASFGSLNSAGRLTISAAGFNIDAGGTAAYTGQSNSVLTVNSGGVVIITNSGNWSVTSNSIVDVQGGTLIVTNNPAGAISFGPNGNHSTANAAGFTNNGGTVVFSQPFNLRGRFSRVHMTGGTLDMQGGGGITESANDQERLWLINGGAVNLGNFTLSRTVHTFANGGVVISNGTINATSLQIGNSASRAGFSLAGGVFTNTGSFVIGDRNNAATSGERRVFFYVRGGTMVSTTAAGIIIGNQSNAGAAAANIFGANLDVGGTGTLYAEGITLVKDATLSNVHGSLLLGGTGIIYLGSGGLIGNVGVSGTTYAVSLSGGTLAAKNASFGIGADLTFASGTTTIKCADGAGTSYDIWMTNVIAGSGTFAKTGGGNFIVLGTATHTGNILINEGKLTLESTGALPASAVIAVATGATFDVGSAFTLNSGKVLRGTGTVTNNVTAATGSTLKPADDATTGTLTFKNDVTESGGVNNNFDLTTPAGSDKLVVQGTLNLSGVNPVNINFVGSPTVGTYQLVAYNALVGDVSNFSYGGLGYLTNNTFTKTIDLILTVERAATNLVWKGDGVLNNWDFNSTFNWTNNGSGATFKFLVGDSVTFNNQGSTTPAVNLVGDLQPNGVTVNASVDHTFTGAGKITGLTALTKTNTGKLTIQTANDYTGVTTLAGGTVSATTLENFGTASSIGAAAASAANVVFNGGTLEYLGASHSIDRSATLQAGGGTIRVADGSAALAQTGTLTGPGSLTKTGPGQLGLNTANNYAGGTLVTDGSIRTGQGNNVNISALGTGNLTLNGTVTPAALVFGGDQEVLTNLLVVTGNNNFTTNNGNNTVVTMTGTGTLTLEGAGGSTFTFDGNMSTFSGTIVAGSLGNPRFHPSSGSSNALFDLGTGTAFLNNRNGGLTYHIGALIGGPATQLRGASTGNNPSTYSIGGKNLSTTFDGNIVDGPAAARYANVLKVGTGVFTLTGISTYTGSTTVSNGILALTGAASIDGSALIQVASPGVLDVTGHADGSLTIGAFVAQTIGGVGQVWGSITNGAFGTIAPGFSIGTLTVTNAVGMLPGSTAKMEVNRNGGSPLSDKLVSPAIGFDGTLQIVNIGAPLQVGDTFDLFDGSLAGVFTTIAGGYYTWDTSNVAINGTVSVSGLLPLPQISSISYSGADVTLSAGGGIPNGAVSVLTTTNLNLPLASWTVAQVGAFDGSGNFTSAPITVTPGEAQQYFVLAAQ